MDEVIIGAPFEVTEGLLEKIYKVDLVIHGYTMVQTPNNRDPYEVNNTSSYLFICYF